MCINRIQLEIHGGETVDGSTFVSGNIKGLHVHDDTAALGQEESALK